jgi:hypothetical protein
VKSYDRNGRQGHLAQHYWIYQQGQFLRRRPCIFYVKQHLGQYDAEKKGVHSLSSIWRELVSYKGTYRVTKFALTDHLFKLEDVLSYLPFLA